MSYDWTMMNHAIHIAASKFSMLRDAVLIANDLDLPDRAREPGISDHDFIIELFSEHGFEADFEKDSDDLVVLIQDGSNLREQDKLCTAIAPYCKEGSYIEGRGEEGEYWRWTMLKDGMEEQQGIIFYDTDNSVCPMREVVTLCIACPFSLICNTSGNTVLKSAQCSTCGGTVVYKDADEITGPIAGVTCTCLKRKFDVSKA